MWQVTNKDKTFLLNASNLERADEAASIIIKDITGTLAPTQPIAIIYDNGYKAKHIYGKLWVLFTAEGKQLEIDEFDHIEESAALELAMRSKMIYNHNVTATWLEPMTND